jgi:hypothetical protein
VHQRPRKELEKLTYQNGFLLSLRHMPCNI